LLLCISASWLLEKSREAEGEARMPSARANGIDIYFERGGGGPAWLLIHGLGGDARQWGPFVEAAGGTLAMIAYDMRGSARSSRPAGPYAMSALAKDAAGLLEALSVRPAGVIGFSMGGCVAIELALGFPGLVERLVLVSTLPSWGGPHPPSARARELFRRTDITDELLTEVYEVAFGPAFRRGFSAGEYVAMRKGDEFPQPAGCYLAQLAALEGFDARDRVGSISAETLVVAGTEDRVVPPANSRWLCENIPGARIELIEGAGHMVPVEAPGALAGLMAAWELR
jgi:pimeloyl-ACP methyl ester carboxylesterase